LFECARKRLGTAFGDHSAHSKAGLDFEEPAQAHQGNPYGALRDLDPLDSARQSSESSRLFEGVKVREAVALKAENRPQDNKYGAFGSGTACTKTLPRLKTLNSSLMSIFKR
jgi:hypothetical protein